MILGISQRELLIAVIVQSETPAISQAAHSKSVWNTKSSGTYQPIMSNPIISMLISKRHVIWWVCPILWYSQLLPSNQSTCFLWLSWHSFLPIFFILAFEGLATPGPTLRASITARSVTHCLSACILYPLICPTPGLLPITPTTSSYLHWSYLHWSSKKVWLWSLQSSSLHHIAALGSILFFIHK